MPRDNSAVVLVRGGTKNNSKITGETVLMMCHNICVCFKGAIWKIIPKLSLLPLLIWSTG